MTRWFKWHFDVRSINLEYFIYFGRKLFKKTIFCHVLLFQWWQPSPVWLHSVCYGSEIQILLLQYCAHSPCQPRRASSENLWISCDSRRRDYCKTATWLVICLSLYDYFKDVINVIGCTQRSIQDASFLYLLIYFAKKSFQRLAENLKIQTN